MEHLSVWDTQKNSNKIQKSEVSHLLHIITRIHIHVLVANINILCAWIFSLFTWIWGVFTLCYVSVLSIKRFELSIKSSWLRKCESFKVIWRLSIFTTLLIIKLVQEVGHVHVHVLSQPLFIALRELNAGEVVT